MLRKGRRERRVVHVQPNRVVITAEISGPVYMRPVEVYSSAAQWLRWAAGAEVLRVREIAGGP